MKTLLLIVLAGLALGACKKSPESPAPEIVQSTTTTTNPPPPPVNHCQGGTVPYSLPGLPTIPSNSSDQYTITGFDLGCGDTLHVYIRKDSGQAWAELGNVNQGASYYALSGQVVTVFNMTGITMEVAITAVLY